MNDGNNSRPRRSRMTVVVIGGVMIAAVGGAVPTLAPGPRLVLIAVGALYLMVTLATGFGPRGSLAERALLFAQVVLGVVVILVSKGEAALAVTPTISAFVVIGSSARGAAVAAVFLAAIALSERLQGTDGRTIAVHAAGNLSAALFVHAFSRLLVDEARERAKSERLSGELGHANERLRAYAARIEHVAIETERSRIARDIHDGLGHTLTVLSVQLEAARLLLRKDPSQAAGHVERAQAVARQGLAEVRSSVALLREPGSLGAPLSESLAELVEDCRESGLETSLRVDGEARAVPATVRATLFRTAQEGLTNVRRHASARCAAVLLSYESDAVSLTIEDDGVGAESLDGGFGLLGIRERASLLGGSVALESSPGRGTRLAVRVPS